MFTEYGCLWKVILAQNKKICGISLALSVTGEGSSPGKAKIKILFNVLSIPHTLLVKTMIWVYKRQ